MAEDNKDPRMLVETTGDFMFTDSSVMPGQDIQPNRPSVVRPSTLIEQKIAKKQIKVLEAEWSGENDEEFGKKWEKDPKSAYSKSSKVKAAVAANEAKAASQIKMNNLTRTGEKPRTPDTIYDTPAGREAFEERTEGKK